MHPASITRTIPNSRPSLARSGRIFPPATPSNSANAWSRISWRRWSGEAFPNEVRCDPQPFTEAMSVAASDSDFIRPIPAVPWRGITVIVVLIVLAAAGARELYVRSIGYGPTLNDTEDLWTQARRAVQPESLVIVGDSPLV